MLRKLLLLLMALVPLLVAGSADRGVVLELDRERFELTARDLADGTEGPSFQVVLGSPSHPTPSGEFPLYTVVLNPGWSPGAFARSQGARPSNPSPDGPLGVGKIAFAERGEISIHGAADPLLVGKPVSLGCVRALDAEFLALVQWLEVRGALAAARPQADGELHRFFRRPARVVVR